MHQSKEIFFSSLTLKSFILGWGMVLLYVGLNSYGALALENQIQKLGECNFTTMRSCGSYFWSLFSSLKTWIAVGAIFGSLGAWILALTRLELSKAYPVAVALNLFIIVSLSVFYNHESLSYSKVVGIILIAMGVLVLSK